MTALLPIDTQAAAPLAADPWPAALRAARAIPPAWDLAATVAVNPFLGQAEESLALAAARLTRVSGASATPPRAWLLDRLESGEVGEADLSGALDAAPEAGRPADLAALKAITREPSTTPTALPTVADLAARVTGTDWPGIVAERLGAWMAGYFDAGQALWTAPRGRSAYAAWRATATHDLTPEILGLGGFTTFVAEAPETAAGVLARAAARLELPAAAMETYFHQLLLGLGGWGQIARRRMWEAERAGGCDGGLVDLLAIRLLWEEALYDRHAAEIAAPWSAAREAHAAPLAPTADQVADTILLEAVERAGQRELAATFGAMAGPDAAAASSRPALQAAFCIDVRSEVFRRALESLDADVQTVGFAGFFGLAVAHRRFASDVTEPRAPVLLSPGLSSRAGGAEPGPAEVLARIKLRAKRAWGRFKLAAVSSFAFVEASGPLYAGRLLRDSFGLGYGPGAEEPTPVLDPALDLTARIASADTILRAMSLTQDFARLVLILGHGATTANNPHASALHCGACGGATGEVNARLLAGLLNAPEVREGLAARGLTIPADTLFLAGLHDTTTDAVTLYANDVAAPEHAADLAQARAWLASAGRLARSERSARLPGAAGEADPIRRSRDWSEVRPEWGLAGCRAFIAAPRALTRGADLKGRAFLHDYDWRGDPGFAILELILTAPVVVASWISLQYYGSTVAPAVFGGGDKLLHNVVGGVGVVEGNGGPLRTGLPWQSVHDGEGYAHQPVRLTVFAAAPREAISGILERHPSVRALFDNRWLHLIALDDAGRAAWRYAGGLAWAAALP